MKYFCVVLLFVVMAVAPAAGGKDLDDRDGKPKTGQGKAKGDVEVIRTPDGKKLTIDHGAGTWRDDAGRSGKLDQWPGKGAGGQSRGNQAP